MQDPQTVADAIMLAMRALGGKRHISEVKSWIDAKYPGRWRDVGTPMADLTFPGNRSSYYAPDARFLERTGKGEYQLRAR